MMRVEWTRKARGDVARVIGFLRERSPTAAGRAYVMIREATLQLSQFPDSGRIYHRNPKQRELLIPFGRHGYSLLYEVRGEVVVIANLKHQREAGY